MASLGALPNVMVIGAMKSGTTAVHRYLDAHPQVSMAAIKEVNFFVGDEDPQVGQWQHGLAWYASLFDAAAPVRGESSPGYTSPDHLEVPARMAKVVPDARLVYLVRHPVDRAMSQYLHHRRDGAERRPVEVALPDPASQYVPRSRYHERVQPFLRRFGREQLLVVVQERLLADPATQLRRVYEHVGADPAWTDPGLDERRRPPPALDIPAAVGAVVAQRVADDVEALRALMDDDLAEWSR